MPNDPIKQTVEKNATALGTVAQTTPAPLTPTEKAALSQAQRPQGSVIEQKDFTKSLEETAERIKAAQLARSTMSISAWQGGLDGEGGDAPNVVRPNVLRDYTNYTYNLSWHIVTPEQFNVLVKNPTDYKPTNVLVASAGTMINNRVKEFKEDFYFDSLSVSTIIGLNARSRESNAIELSFSIVEPYGCSLLDKLVEVTQRLVTGSTDKGNYLTMPYMIQIDFLGYDDQGAARKIAGHTKYLPIKLIEMKIKPDASGSKYQIRAVPYHHQIYNQSMGIIPANYEITAGDLNTLFKASGQDNLSEQFKSAQASANQKAEQAMQNATRGLDNAGIPSRTPEAQAEIRKFGDSQRVQELSNIKDQVFVTASLGDALNNWYKLLVDQKLIEKPDDISFVFADEIGKSPLVLEKKQTEKKQAPSGKNKDIKEGKAATQGAKSAISNSSIYPVTDTQNMFRVNAGSSILNLIDLCVRNSEYIRKQIQDANDQAAAAANKDSRDAASGNSGAPLKWFKITAEVTKLGDFDRIRNEFSKSITYIINVYEVTNVKYPFVTQKKATKWTKEYNYFYTGKNTDVIALDINFDTMFYTTVSTNPDRFKETNQVPDVAPTTGVESKSRMGSQTGVPFPVQKRPTNNLADLVTAGYSTRDVKVQAVADLSSSLMNNSRGDMLHLKMDIIGDPDFIKQDDLFFTRSAKSSRVNNSIATDDGQVNVKLNFKLPHDWDRNRGVLTPSSDTVFDGLYRVLRVDSTFERGLFKQTLDMIRLYDDEADLKRRNQQATDYAASEGVDQAGEAKKDSSGIEIQEPEARLDPKPGPAAIETVTTQDELPPLERIIIAPAPVLEIDITGGQ